LKKKKEKKPEQEDIGKTKKHDPEIEHQLEQLKEMF
jgi:hypothetical protein